MGESREIQRRRARFRRRYRDAYATLNGILFSEDPIHISFGENTDEYEPEVSTILPRLQGCASVDEVQNVVYEEFVKWFGSSNAGSPEQYSRIAERIWTELIEPLSQPE